MRTVLPLALLAAFAASGCLAPPAVTPPIAEDTARDDLADALGARVTLLAAPQDALTGVLAR